MSNIPIPTTPRPRRSTATSTNTEEREGPSTIGSQRNKEDSVLLFGESPSKKGSSSVKYGGKRKSGGPLGPLVGPGSIPSASKTPDLRRESLSARLGIGRDVSDSISTPTSTSKRKNSVSRGSKKKPESSAPGSVSTPTPTSQKSKNLKRNHVVSMSISTDEEQRQDLSGSELSELTTPPSSPVRMTVKQRGEQQPPSTKISFIPISSSSLSGSPKKQSASKTQKSTYQKPKPVSKSASWAPSTANGMTEVLDTWSLERLGNHVWVMLGLGLPDGRVLVYQSSEDGEGGQEDGLQWCWWPAKLRRSKVADKDTLILTPYSLSTSPKNRDLQLPVANASSSNILSFSNNLEHVRFEKLTFLSRSSHNVEPISAVQRSPKKKRKLEKSGIEARFDQALALALEDEESLNDGVPSLYNALSRGGSFSTTNAPVSRKGKSRQVAKDSISDDNAEVNGGEGEWDDVVDSGADELLDIPGERVLCRATKNPATAYWPAQVIDYVPPPSRIRKKTKGKSQESMAGKYRVVFLDELEMEVPRDWFYASHEDGFGRCKLGKFQSEFVDNPNDTADDEDSYSDFDFEAEYDSISQGSGSNTRQPEFASLSLPTQFVHVIPVLQAVLKNKYPPTRDRHEQFMRGGRLRDTLTTEGEAGLRGRMNPKNMDVFAKLVECWCLGSSRREIETEENTDDRAVKVINVDGSEEQSGSRTSPDWSGEVPEAQSNGVQGKSIESTSNAEQATTDDIQMVLDVGARSMTTITDPAPLTTTPNGTDAHMDVLDEVSFKENHSPHSPPPMEIDTKPQSEGIVTDIQLQGPEEVETSVPIKSPPQSSHPSSSVTTPSVELELDDKPGLAPPLPLFITTQDTTTVSQDSEEQSPLTPIAEPIISAPPTAFEGNGERPRKKRERQTGCESFEALGGVEKVSVSLLFFPSLNLLSTVHLSRPLV
ncbi:hypothetical protein E1B28_009212 [Marasmius oreades]|uniref:PWWP domain-containing protein n=1 Tax=Marasmius oreades TaxID=181124 RepID=A0A9P7S057_9AGAR|nr:uncharacterized protein E1B28_009212 [Marasmius oreades]KAG7092907.1 hypothetical protein E1B28_009212 [Marasmius oreades]